MLFYVIIYLPVHMNVRVYVSVCVYISVRAAITKHQSG